MQTGTRRVVLVGTGFVGMSFAYSMVNQGGAEELVLIDVNHEKAVGEAMDLNHGIPFGPEKLKSGLEITQTVKQPISLL